MDEYTVNHEQPTHAADDFAKAFVSDFNTQFKPLEHRRIVNFIETFTINCRQVLASFLGRSLDFAFNGIDFWSLDEKAINNNSLSSNFHILPYNLQGLILFDYPLLHGIIDSLYGTRVSKRDLIIKNPGKSGLRIAEKIAELCLACLQKTIIDYEKIDTKLLKTSDELKLVLNQDMPRQFFNVSFIANIDELSGLLTLAIPEKIMKDLAQDTKNTPLDVTIPPSAGLADTLKQDIIESLVTVAAVFPEIKLKFKDVLALKSGDLIPLTDPSLAYLTLNQKKLFKVGVGQANAVRVVKILDNV